MEEAGPEPGPEAQGGGEEDDGADARPLVAPESGKCGFRDFFPTLLDRYFSRRFELQKPKNENTADRSHHLVFEHSNGLFVLCVSKQHPLLKDGMKSVEFEPA